MLATLVVFAQLFTAPAPIDMVIDGCNTATAAKVAQVRATHEQRNVRLLFQSVLAAKDGTTCLVESPVLIELHKTGKNQDLVQQALLGAMRSKNTFVVRRAHVLAIKLRDIDPSAYDTLLRRATQDPLNAWNAMPTPREPGEAPPAAQ